MSNARGPKAWKKTREAKYRSKRRKRRVKGYVKKKPSLGEFDYPGSKEYMRRI
jgi:hypothetical protein